MVVEKFLINIKEEVMPKSSSKNIRKKGQQNLRSIIYFSIASRSEYKRKNKYSKIKHIEAGRSGFLYMSRQELFHNLLK